MQRSIQRFLLSIATLAALFWALPATAQTRVGHWKLDGDFTDSGETGADGTPVGSPTSTTGKFGGAYTFDGTTQHVSMGDVAAFEFSSASTFTLVAWCNPNGADEVGYVVGKGHTSPSQGYLMQWDGANDELRLVLPGSAGTASNSVFTDNGVWTHGAIVFAAGDVTFYRNGQPAGSANSVTFNTPTSVNARIAARDGEAGSFNGDIDDVRIYDGALTAQQVEQIYLGHPAAKMYYYRQQMSSD